MTASQIRSHILPTCLHSTACSIEIVLPLLWWRALLVGSSVARQMPKYTISYRSLAITTTICASFVFATFCKSDHTAVGPVTPKHSRQMFGLKTIFFYVCWQCNQGYSTSSIAKTEQDLLTGLIWHSQYGRLDSRLHPTPMRKRKSMPASESHTSAT